MGVIERAGGDDTAQASIGEPILMCLHLPDGARYKGKPLEDESVKKLAHSIAMTTVTGSHASTASATQHRNTHNEISDVNCLLASAYMVGTYRELGAFMGGLSR